MVRNYVRKTEDRWSIDNLKAALKDMDKNKIKMNDAAKKYNISRATLYRHWKKFNESGRKWNMETFRRCGGVGAPILTKIEEDVLKKTVMDLREHGSCVHSSDVKRLCFEYCETNGIPNQFNKEKRMASDDWYYGFLKRHPEAKLEITVSQGSSKVEEDEEDREGEVMMEQGDIEDKREVTDQVREIEVEVAFHFM